jgi:cell division protein FtsN
VTQGYGRGKKGTSKPGKQNAAARRSQPQTSPRGRGLRLYLAGVLSGVFISFIAWLAALPDPGTTADEVAGTSQSETPVPRPRFEFFDLLPEQTIEVEEEIEPAVDISKPGTGESAERYILQAGSFRQEEDARRRRAELILLGLNPTIREAGGESGRLFRVYLGPFDSLDSVSRARSLTANEHIETLVLRRGEP